MVLCQSEAQGQAGLLLWLLCFSAASGWFLVF